MRNFIRTKTEPAIFYLPRTLNPKTQALVEESTRAIDEKIEAKKSEIEKELDALTQESEALMSLDQSSENAVDTPNDSPEQQQSDESKSNNVTTTLQSGSKEEAEEALGQEPADVELVEEEMSTEAGDSSEVAASNVAVVPNATNDALSTSSITMPEQAQEPQIGEK